MQKVIKSKWLLTSVGIGAIIFLALICGSVPLLADEYQIAVSPIETTVTTHSVTNLFSWPLGNPTPVMNQQTESYDVYRVTNGQLYRTYDSTYSNFITGQIVPTHQDYPPTPYNYFYNASSIQNDLSPAMYRIMPSYRPIFNNTTAVDSQTKIVFNMLELIPGEEIISATIAGTNITLPVGGNSIQLDAPILTPEDIRIIFRVYIPYPGGVLVVQELKTGSKSIGSGTNPVLILTIRRTPVGPPPPDIEILTTPNQGIDKNESVTGDPFFTHNGELNMAVTDLTIPGRGMPFRFTRAYRSQIDFNGPLGYGWDFNYNERLIEKTADNKVLYFKGSARRDEFISQPDGSYTAPSGFYMELTKLPDGTFQILERDGTKKIFGPHPLLPNVYCLLSLTDRNHNQLSFQYNDNGQLTTVIDTLSREIKFNWNDKGRLSEIEDFSGRKVKYGYDDDYNLTSVTSPATDEYPQGNTTHYTYSAGLSGLQLNHNLLSVTDNKNQTYISNQYNQDDRIETQIYGTDSFQISYVTNTDNTLITTVIDRKGNKKVYYHNQLGNAVREDVYTQALGIITTQWEYNSNGERTKTILPKGNIIDYLYNAQGNLLSVKRTDPANPSYQLTTLFAYEPSFNQVNSITDALNRVTTFYFDYDEATMGDLNGDDITTQQNGNIVKIVYPAVTKGLSAGQVIEAKFQYNEFGQLVQSIDPQGKSNAYEYYTAYNNPASEGYLKTITRDFGGANVTNSFEYDALGNITAIYDGKGNKTAFTVNALNQVTATLSRLGHSVRFHYDANGNIDQLEVENRDKDGNPDPNLPWITSTYNYDILDNLLSKTEQVSAAKTIATQYGYDANGNRDLITQPELNQIKNYYDERNLLVETIRGYGTIDWNSVKRRYDLNGNMEKVIDGRGKETTYQVDGFDRMTGYMDALGNSMEQELDAVGNVLCVRRKDASGVVLSEAKYLYDELNRNYETQTWLNTTGGWVITRNEFDKNSRVVRAIDANNHQRLVEYDGLGRVKSSTDHLGNKVEYTYDSNSNVTVVTESETPLYQEGQGGVYITSNQYDNLDRLIKSTNPINVVRAYSFDSRNNLTYTKDGEGNTSSNVYDGLNRLVQTMRDIREGGNGSGAVIKQITTQYQWDDNSRLTSLTDDNQNLTHYEYDALNRRKAEYLPDGSHKDLSYDSADNIEKIIDGNGTQISQTFDNINRLTRKDIIKGAGVIGGSYEEFGYDGLSRMTSALNDYSSVAMNYDSLSRLLSETQSSSVSSVKSVVSSYDLVGNRLSLTYPSGKVINFVPDELNRISRIQTQDASRSTLNAEVIAQYSYAGPFRVKGRSYANNTKLTVGYDANRRVTGYSHTGLSAWLLKEKKDKGKGKGKGQEKEYAGIELRASTVGFAYGYDNEDNKKFEKRVHEGGKGDAYTYDSLYRLVSAQYDLPNPMQSIGNNNQPQSTQSWDLDGVGNWNALMTNDQSTNYLINNLNQYTAINGISPIYDRNGTMTFDGSNTLTYDYANRPVKIENKKYCVEFKYDALGRRIEKLVMKRDECDRDDDDKDEPDDDCDELDDAKIIRFYYDGARVIEEYDEENELKRSYIYGNGIDEILVMQKGKKQYWYHENALGSITHISDKKGEVVESYKYAAYGKVTIYDGKGKERKKSKVKNRFMFTGRELDSETGLYYYRARYYSAEMGRFISRDPIGYFDGMNLYTYVRNNSINYTDPFGLEAKNQTINYDELQVIQDGMYNLMGQISDLNSTLQELLTLEWTAKGSPVWGERSELGGLFQWGVIYQTEQNQELLAAVRTPIETISAQIEAKQKALEGYEQNWIRNAGEINFIIHNIPIISSIAENSGSAISGYDYFQGDLSVWQRVVRGGSAILDTTGLVSLPKLIGGLASKGGGLAIGDIGSSGTSSAARGGRLLSAPTGTVTVEDLYGLSQLSEREVGLLRMGSGERAIYFFPTKTGGKLPSGTVRLIAHTHPYTSTFTSADIASLLARGQRSSVLITPSGSAKWIHIK